MEPTSESQLTSPQAEPNPVIKKSKDNQGLVGGLVLIVIGVLFLLQNMLPDFRFGDYWPLILVAIGIGLLWRGRQESRR